MNKSLLKEDFYSILYSWEKEGKPLDFYRFYTTALSNQEECLDFLNAVSKNSKKGNEKFFPILEKVLQSINWYDKETVKKGILSLGRITQVMGADHPLFKNIQHLNLMYNGIKIIDESCLPSYIENLNLHGSTQLKFLSIKNMLGLKELDLSDAKSRPVDSEIRYSFGDDNKIENLPWQNEDEMPKTLELPHSLEVLNLNGRRMEMLPKGLRQLNKLKKMSFSYSFDFKEEDLPPNLEQLELENTRKNSLSLKGMPNLKKLNISSSGYNSYLEIKEGDLPLSLEELTLFSLKEKDIHIKNLTNLKKIRINYCGSLEIKEGDLPSSLEELSMTSFSGEYIPIKNLTNLKNLELSFCDFENFEGINLPLTLKKLNLNGFKKASFSIEHLTNLEELGVANGTLEKMSLPSSLKKINLSPSKVKDIHFKDFPNNLKDIRIQNKVIIHVPPCSEEQKMFLESKGAKVVISKQ